MIFYLIGVNHKTAPIGAREALYRKRQEIAGYSTGYIEGAAVLCTCNRIELYGFAADLPQADISIRHFRGKFREFSRYGYVISGQANVFRHLLRLATGLESQVRGEQQILRQLHNWKLRDPFHAPFQLLVNKALSCARVIRMNAGLDREEYNIADLVSKELIRLLWDRERPEVVIIGTGKIAELFASIENAPLYLHFAGHKNYPKAQELARRSKGQALMLEDLPGALLRADAMISATSSPHFLFSRDYFRKVLSVREKPLYIYDLAIPRDIDPEVKGMKGAVLYDLDNLGEVFNEHHKALSVNLLQAEYMIEEAIRIQGDILCARS
ncbi:MAG: hypothetical protein PHE18_00205 [Candidatus Omnitrophica bacterium]|nr:hypothetical protein [Candidatus Omnitrophota bacterium]MDD5552285.1 hypothetical protein [Candidatus Omnitrophota bacterium]